MRLRDCRSGCRSGFSRDAVLRDKPQSPAEGPNAKHPARPRPLPRLALGLLPICLLARAVPPSSAATDRCVVIVLQPGGWSDVPSRTREALSSLMEEGAAGSLSCAVPRPMSNAAGWVTLGAGNRAIWPDEARAGAFDPGNQPARERLAAILHRANAALPYPIEIGSVGGALHDAGLRTGVLGIREPWHLAAAMDVSGHIDFGSAHVSSGELARALDEADYVVVNGGAAGGDRRLAELIGAAQETLGAGDLLIVAGLAPRLDPFVGLAPIVVRGRGFAADTLTSATTRRAAVVANIDLAPTILTHFRLVLPASYQNGSPMTARHTTTGFDVRIGSWLDAKGIQADAFRRRGFSVLFLLQAILVPVCMVGRWPRARLMLALMCLPIASFIAAFLPASWTPASLLLVIVVASCLVARLLPMGRGPAPSSALGPLLAVAIATGILLLLDVDNGAALQPISPLGYSLGFGARFYGIGNEVAGLFIAAGVLAAGVVLLLARGAARIAAIRSGIAAALLCAGVVTLYIGAPSLGANAGCTIAAVISFGALFVATWGGRRRRMLALLLAVAAPLLLILLACLDASRGPDNMSHIGRAWIRLTSEGAGYLLEFAARKASTAWRTMLLVPIMFALGAWVLLWSYALLRPMPFVRRAYERLPGIRAPMQGIAIGGIVAALLNDSTVTIPAMMLAFSLPALGFADALPEPVAPETEGASIE